MAKSSPRNGLLEEGRELPSSSQARNCCVQPDPRTLVADQGRSLNKYFHTLRQVNTHVQSTVAEEDCPCCPIDVSGVHHLLLSLHGNWKLQVEQGVQLVVTVCRAFDV
jgi:hypothetical protein